MAFPPLEIETSRLLLSRPNDEQIADYYSAIIGTSIFDTILWDSPSGLEELQDWWTESDARDPLDFSLPFTRAVIERESGRYIGGVGLRPVDGNPTKIEIGYAFAVHSHGKGCATEAVGALVDEAFRNRGAERICGSVFVGNHGSRRVMEKLGFVYEGTLRRSVHKRGVWLDEWILAIPRPDWEQHRQEQLSGEHTE